MAEETPDLVFSDIVMAGAIDGLGLARQLRKQHPALPILLATGYSQALQGADKEFAVLRKPYRLQDLNRAISVLLTEARLQPGADRARLPPSPPHRR